ncbi:putative helicase [Vibrio coralliirubri]|uniref:DEAD/DEAH box helicase n=1 Tax=Vibrio coralliirubri TaxID=1516159 RepID=UPI000632C533|nr:DEAD/DEAH box helicase [Vibrio coralliirubri]CDT52903.1 putative helicase [Vibrio coralliirubri]
MIVKIAHNAVHARLIKPSREVRLLVSDMLSFKVDGADFVSTTSWDGSSSFYAMKTDSFPAGFVRLVKRKLELSGHKTQVVSKAAPEPLGETLLAPPGWEPDERYSYQAETVRRLISLRAMIARVATGGGKSIICQLAYLKIKRPTLFVTTRKSLMYQMAEGFEEISGLRSGIIGDGQFKPAHITCATVDTLVSRLEVTTADTYLTKRLEAIEEEAYKASKNALKRAKLPSSDNIIRTAPDSVKEHVRIVKQAAINAVRSQYPKEALWKEAVAKSERQNKRRLETIEFLKTIEFAVLEEAHEVSGNGYYDIMSHCTNAHYRLALTATPFLKDSQEANMRLMACTGPIGIHVSEKDLIDKGILATPYFKYIAINKVAGVNRGTPWQRAYKSGVVDNISRNTHIANECKRAKSYGLPAMVLVQHKEHGKKLESLISKSGLKVSFIFGDHVQEERKEALTALKNGHIDVLIGSTILDVGVDCPAVGLVVLAGGGKAEVNLRQRIGRGLRAKKMGPNVCFVVDFMDTGNNHLIKHSRMRREIVEDTPGFVEGIVTGDFNYEKVGFSKVA